MHKRDLIHSHCDRLAQIEDLEALARSIQAPQSILDTLRARADEIQTTLDQLDELADAAPTARLEALDSQGALAAFAEARGLRDDWHEPDESDIGARVQGNHLDNAMGHCEDETRACGEFNVVLTHDGKDVAVVNLAYLLAIAAGGVK